MNFIKRIQHTDKQWQNSHRDVVRFESTEMNINDTSPGLKGTETM